MKNLFGKKDEENQDPRIKIKRRRKIKAIITLMVLLAIVIGAGALGGFPHLSRHEYEVTVTDKQIKRTNNHDTYMVFTQDVNGRPIVFENTDSTIEFKFNSSDVYAQLVQGKKYKVKAYGWRIPLMSRYENIVKVTEIK
jgi:FlaG/FlaF family flagellin (archaellin)